MGVVKRPVKKRMQKKKKFKSLEEKKKKGIHLSQVERRIVRKRKLQDDLLLQEGITSKQSEDFTPTKDLKRVSFAENLEHTKIFDGSIKKLQIGPSTASPGKGILTKSAVKIVKESEPKLKEKDEVGSTAGDSHTADEERSSKKSLSKKTFRMRVTKGEKAKYLSLPKKERKEYVRKLRLKRSPNFAVSMQCKKLWEKIRNRQCREEDRERYVSELCGLVKGKAKEFIYAHDTSRVFECLLNQKRPGIRNMLFEELKPELLKMIKSSYAKFFVIGMLKVGTPQQRSTVYESIRGNCVSLMRNSSSAKVLETFYNDYARLQERSEIIAEFYSKEAALFKHVNHERILSLEEIIAEDPSKKQSMMNYMQDLLRNIVPKSQINLSLTHHLLYDFITHCDKEQLTEMVDLLKDRIPMIVHTWRGAAVALRCIWNATSKERKLIVKNFKGLVTKACLDEFGHRVMMAIFDSVDDTVLVNKYIIREIGNDIRSVAFNLYGEKVLHYLVHPRDRRFFSSSVLKIFEEGDNNPHSKKQPGLRYSELFNGIYEPLMTFLISNMEELLFGEYTHLLVLNILEKRIETDLFERVIKDEHRLSCYEEIRKICEEEFVPCNMERFHAIEHPHVHFIITKLLKSDQSFSVKLSDSLAKIDSGKLASWISCNKGCFVLLGMFENGSEQTKTILRNAISVKALKNYTTQGAKILYAHLSS
ncbi:hypothetical protein AB6A40_001226 [Gnathostoma spinigerum]|uniref:PUM-HD domain-containing protein n=1 Tax=Gnathostoma spinigerum TaxID=75299 RepID=A0ABD6E5T7_9BILA